MTTGATRPLPSIRRTMARSDGRFKWSICACVNSTASIAGRSFTRTPALRCRRSKISRVANTGSINTPSPFICTKNDECPMNVIACSATPTADGLRGSPTNGCA